MALLNENEEADDLCASMHDIAVKTLHFLEIFLDILWNSLWKI